MTPYSFIGTKWKGGDTIKHIRKCICFCTCPKQRPSLSSILRETCLELEISEADLVSDSRRRHLSDARKIFAMIARSFWYSLPSIGAAINKDHSSIVVCCEVGVCYLDTEASFRSKFQAVKERVEKLPY